MENESFKKLRVLETIFLPDWNTTALICEEGKIHVKLTSAGGYYTKEEFQKDFFDGYTLSFYKDREKLFNELEEYYKDKYSG